MTLISPELQNLPCNWIEYFRLSNPKCDCLMKFGCWPAWRRFTSPQAHRPQLSRGLPMGNQSLVCSFWQKVLLDKTEMFSFHEKVLWWSNFVSYMKQNYVTMTKLEKVDDNNFKHASLWILIISFLTLFGCGFKIATNDW